MSRMPTPARHWPPRTSRCCRRRSRSSTCPPPDEETRQHLKAAGWGEASGTYKPGWGEVNRIYKPGWGGIRMATIAQQDDDALLPRFGYRQQFVRSLRHFESFAVAFSFISITTGIFTTYSFALV